MKKFVVFYEAADDLAAKAPPVYPAHVAWVHEFRDQGTLLMLGTFGDPQREGSMAIFSTREAAENFANGDPMVVQGVVRKWILQEWNETLGEI
jgi:uncharacterized protein YciI